MNSLLETLPYKNNRPSIWLMRQAGRYLPEYRNLRQHYSNFLDFCYTPEAATEATLQPISRFELNASIVFSDILVIPDALGQQVNFIEGEGPRLSPLNHLHPLQSLNEDNFLDFLSPVFETISCVREKLPQETPLIGFSGAPWTLAAYMIEGRGGTNFDALKNYIKDHPKQFNDLITFLIPIITKYLIEQVKNGANILQIFDSWSFHAPQEHLKSYIIEPTKKIVEGVHKVFPQIPIIGYTRGLGKNLLIYAEETGLQGIGLDSTIDISWATLHIPQHIVLQGNLSPHILVEGGDALTNAINTIHHKMQGRPYIFNVGEGVLPTTPVENVHYLVNYVNNL